MCIRDSCSAGAAQDAAVRAQPRTLRAQPRTLRAQPRTLRAQPRTLRCGRSPGHCGRSPAQPTTHASCVSAPPSKPLAALPPGASRHPKAAALLYHPTSTVRFVTEEDSSRTLSHLLAPPFTVARVLCGAQVQLCRRAKRLAAGYRASGAHPAAYLARHDVDCPTSLEAAGIRFD
eukprot:1483291-Prymnesium_polylepis.2